MIPTNLHYVVNELGHSELEVTGKYPNGSWMKWKKVLELTDLSSSEWAKYTERSIAPCEVVLDYDHFNCVRCGTHVDTYKCKKCHKSYNKLQFRKNMSIMIKSV